MQSIRQARDRWNKNIIDGFINFSNHDTSNTTNILDPNVNLGLASMTKCDNMFSDPESDHIFYIFGYVPGFYYYYHFMW